MKNLLSIFALLLAFSFTASAQVLYPVNSKINTRINPKIKYPGTFTYQPNCPDLQANVKIQVVRRYNQYSGLVKITGTAKNIGKKDFVGNASQMSVVLYEVMPGGRTRVLSRASYPSVRSGQTKTLPPRYVRWSLSNEFPPNYRVTIMYDPDIKMDGNPRNDDCNSRNNSKTRSGAEISRLFTVG